jgi:Fe2+ transport system protein FeoA
MKRITDMVPHESGKIKMIERVDLACVQRLMVLGFVEGSTVKYLSAALGGNPVEVLIEQSRICLHGECASHFFVE